MKLLTKKLHSHAKDANTSSIVRPGFIDTWSTTTPHILSTVPLASFSLIQWGNLNSIRRRPTRKSSNRKKNEKVSFSWTLTTRIRTSTTTARILTRGTKTRKYQDISLVCRRRENTNYVHVCYIFLHIGFMFGSCNWPASGTQTKSPTEYQKHNRSLLASSWA